MKRTSLCCVAALALALLGCGDDETVTPNPDNRSGTAVLQATRSGLPLAGVPILIHDANGALVAAATTGDDGTLEIDVERRAAVTVATDQGDLVTIADIEPGARVVWNPANETEQDLVSTALVSAPGAAQLGADALSYMACGRSETSLDPHNVVSMGIDPRCLRGEGSLELLGVAIADEGYGPELVAFSQRDRIVPNLGDNTVVSLGSDWESDWQVVDLSVNRPIWASLDATFSGRGALNLGEYTYSLPAAHVGGSVEFRFPTGSSASQLTSVTWEQTTPAGSIARSSQWVQAGSLLTPDWIEPAHSLTASADVRPIVVWSGRLGTTAATEITWTTSEGLRSWTFIGRGDRDTVVYPELSGEGAFLEPSFRLSGVRAFGLTRGVESYTNALASGMPGELVWPDRLRRSVATGGTAAHLTEIVR